MQILFLFGIVMSVALGEDERFLGCYSYRSSPRSYKVPQFDSVDQCITQCKLNYYRYAYINNDCICGNYLGEKVSSLKCESSSDFNDIYITGNLVPGPLENVRITNITNHSVHISWEPPKSYTEITSYLITAKVNHTYANFIPNTPEWSFTNDTFRTKIILLPATKYKVVIRAIAPDGPGAESSQFIETLLGDPENLPDKPKIVKNYGNKISIKIMETVNSNGPISSYLVVVINENAQQIVQEQLLKSYDEAKKEGLSYYITAELKPESINSNFIVGDGRYYGGYYNAPLDPNLTYNIIIGIVSSLNGQTKRAFNIIEVSHKEVLKKEVKEVDGDSPAVIIGLSIAIGLLSFMLIAGIVGFIILKSRVTNRRQRLSDNQELTLQGPMIEVENNGYIPEIEEDHSKINHYKMLKQKIRTIPYGQLKIEPNNLLGIGRFGRVNCCSLYENNTLIPVAAYSISDKKMSSEDKKNMLKDLDLLIKVGKHENIIAFVGTCETPQMVVIVLEYISLNLKDLLLGSRDSLPGRFSNMTENQALNIAINISKGMAHLESNQIVHKQLCARNILIANGFMPKISGYGLAQYYSHNNLPDYTRWTALEVFKGQMHNPKSDVWSFACLLWEIAVLGGTPYGNFSNNEIPERIIKGLRLPQIQYFSDELYQVMLNCWQVDMDERPTFNHLTESLQLLAENSLIPCLNFNLYSNFQYEQFYPDMEIAVRPVF